ncbi:Haemolymph juvenile hormone Hypothetical protein protein (JHBP) [Nesidiocoris tenuis]|uniref:Lipid-binding serum glycoprotein N-terminal domain-containing protein n=1 Tax=Nesidiocoris tenuis TaxID=355587 RepID=A0ABN7AUH1_9HEMI|nr:Haemolymph juvenile hormone Hypothetical protein protein (JHBP) [Nesidiocoris tenuis]
MSYLPGSLFLQVLSLCSLTLALQPSDIFSWTKQCSLSSPTLTDCLKFSFQEIINNFDNEEDQDEEERVDPLLIPEIPFSYGGELSPDRLDLTLSGLALHGLSKSVVTGVRVNVNDKSALRLEVDLRNPLYYLEGDYSVRSERSFSAEGSFNVSIYEVRGTLVIKGHVIEIDDIEYLQVDRTSFKPYISDIKLTTKDRGSDPGLTQMVVTLVNMYWRQFYEDFLPLVEEALGDAIRAYAEALIENVPLAEIILP